MQAQKLAQYTAQFLNSTQYRDYSPNGLQIEGRNEISQVLAGVSANLPLIERAIETRADAILVHHGFFWKNEDPRLVGWKKRRIQKLLEHDINLFAYHLPLDAHPVVGNNAQLAQLLGLTLECHCGDQDLVHIGRCVPTTLDKFARHIQQVLLRKPIVIGNRNQRIERVGWCSGGAQQMFHASIEAGVDTYLTGEISEHNVDMALENGVSFIAAGHYATERYGVQALGAHWKQEFGIACSFFDTGNPV